MCLRQVVIIVPFYTLGLIVLLSTPKKKMLSCGSRRFCIRSSLAASLFGTLAGCISGLDKQDPRKTSFLLEDNSFDSKTSSRARIPSFFQKTDASSVISDASSTTSGIDGQHISHICEILFK